MPTDDKTQASSEFTISATIPFCVRDFAGELFLARLRRTSPFARRSQMAWKAPKIVEVPVGMEINMYACAAASSSSGGN